MVFRKMIGNVCHACWALMIIAAFCSEVQAQELNVVSTNSILADWVDHVGGDLVRSAVLVGVNGDPHTFEPSPKDDVLLKKADVIFEIGLHLEPWLDKLYRSSGSKAIRNRVTEDLMLIRADGRNEDDPHVWHDVGNAVIMVQAIRDALIKADPQHSNGYRNNADVYLAKLSTLDAWVVEEIVNIPKARRKLVTSHDTFGYFSRRYGFEIIGAVIDSATTEAADPSAFKIAQLVEKIKASAVTAIFVENVANPQMAQAIAREAGVKVAPQLYSDALGAPGSDGEDYIKMMTHNVRTIVEALR